ncbi:heme-binding protein [Streptomyces sp. NBC_00046]|uniref:GlcG/HbpS family heme-binding protein n=1 Tax=Streptomyces sp. NBC_00046 TaxID=2975626 RepID=UPI003869621F
MKHARKTTKRMRLVIGGTLAGAAALGTFAVVSVNAGSSPSAAARSEAAGENLARSTHLSIDAACRAAQAVLDAAAKENQRVAVADRNGNAVVTLRGDGAGPQSYEAAEKKAFTAVSWNAPTSELVKRLENTPKLKDIPGTLFLGGGVPVDAEGAPIAGIGVAGAPSGDLDEKFARAGAAALDK